MKRKISEEHDLNKKLSRPRFSQHNYRKIHRREKKDVRLYLKLSIIKNKFIEILDFANLTAFLMIEI